MFKFVSSLIYRYLGIWSPFRLIATFSGNQETKQLLFQATPSIYTYLVLLEKTQRFFTPVFKASLRCNHHYRIYKWMNYNPGMKRQSYRYLAIGMPSNRANALAEFYLLEGYVPCYDFLPKMPLTMKWDLFKTSL